MQDRETLKNYAKTLGFNLGQTEKDYLQHIILAAVSENTGKELVFKGGTSLQKTINMPRYSEDLDFTATKNTDTGNLAERIQEKIRYYGYENHYTRTNPETGETIKYRIKGPLYNQNPLTEATLRLEISRREDTLLETKTHAINPIYDDVPEYTVNTMHPQEILAEKIRALYTRAQPRDLYDINYLLKKNTILDKELVQKKLAYYNKTIHSVNIEDTLRNLKNPWNNEMKMLVAKSPEHQQVAEYVLKKFKENGF